MVRNMVTAFVVAVFSGVLILMVSFAWRMFQTAFGKKPKPKDRSAR